MARALKPASPIPRQITYASAYHKLSFCSSQHKFRKGRWVSSLANQCPSQTAQRPTLTPDRHFLQEFSSQDSINFKVEQEIADQPQKRISKCCQHCIKTVLNQSRIESSSSVLQILKSSASSNNNARQLNSFQFRKTENNMQLS